MFPLSFFRFVFPSLVFLSHSSTCVSCLFRGIGMTTYNLGVAGLLVAAVVWADANAQVRTVLNY